jgi:hypothetical protein
MQRASAGVTQPFTRVDSLNSAIPNSLKLVAASDAHLHRALPRNPCTAPCRQRRRRAPQPILELCLPAYLILRSVRTSRHYVTLRVAKQAENRPAPVSKHARTQQTREHKKLRRLLYNNIVCSDGCLPQPCRPGRDAAPAQLRAHAHTWRSAPALRSQRSPSMTVLQDPKMCV